MVTPWGFVHRVKSYNYILNKWFGPQRQKLVCQLMGLSLKLDYAGDEQ